MREKKKLESEPPLEPMVAHGSRMSWAGILRPGNEFTRARKSQLAILKGDSTHSLKRYFGTWNSAYRRFTTNLSTVNLFVDPQPGNEARYGIQCILHWVDQKDMVRSDKGSVCHGDGWPKELWDTFIGELTNLPKGSVAEKLQSFLNSELREENQIVSKWRDRVKRGTLVPLKEQEGIDKSWIPVPARLITHGKSESMCIFSWSPGAVFYSSLSEALASSQAISRKPDPINQAIYYVECTLAKLHGVSFDSPNDLLEDKEYARRPEVSDVWDTYSKLEQERITDHTKFGRLDNFGSEG